MSFRKKYHRIVWSSGPASRDGGGSRQHNENTDDRSEEDVEKAGFSAMTSIRRSIRKPSRNFSILCFCALAFVTISCRYIGKWYFAANNKVSVPMPKNSSFAVATKPIFFFDLGGTMCMCEQKWVVHDYWAKVFSGFAFNFAHVVGTFEFYVFLLDYKLILIAVFLNEMIEELWLTSGYWGFTLDPPYDQEARYDSLVRDTVCCMLGIHLAVRFGKLMRVQPLVKWPIRWTGADDNNPHSVWRWLKFGVQALCMWQITLIFNADRGPFHFNLNNVFLIVCYDAAVFIFFVWNVNDYDARPSHVFAWYFGWAFVISFVFGFAVYPVFQSAMYLILAVESLLSLLLTALELLLHQRPAWFNKHVFGTAGIEHIYAAPAGAVRLETLSKAISQLDLQGIRHISLNEFTDLANSIHQSIFPHPKGGPGQVKAWSSWKKLSICGSVLLRLTIIVVASSQPLLYHGPQYKRHWCGNPDVGWGNGCP
jgi:hypothetical protein